MCVAPSTRSMSTHTTTEGPSGSPSDERASSPGPGRTTATSCSRTDESRWAVSRACTTVPLTPRRVNSRSAISASSPASATRPGPTATTISSGSTLIRRYLRAGACESASLLAHECRRGGGRPGPAPRAGRADGTRYVRAGSGPGRALSRRRRGDGRGGRAGRRDAGAGGAGGVAREGGLPLRARPVRLQRAARAGGGARTAHGDARPAGL